jgi:hypothetical protein
MLRGRGSGILSAARVAFAVAAGVGCSVPIASLRAVTVEGVGMERLAAGHVRAPGRGRSCRWWVLGVPLGLPRIEEALEAAFNGQPALGMREATVRSEHPVYGLLGEHCYSITGMVVE